MSGSGRRWGLRVVRVVPAWSLLVLGLLTWAPPALAWNPLKALRTAPGRFIDAATAPAIQNGETAGLRLIEDLDLRLGRQVGSAGTLATSLVSQVDRVAGARLAQVDLSLEARILQVSTSADALVHGALGQLDEVSRKRIDQAGGVARSLVLDVDATLQKTLKRADEILKQREAQIGTIVTDALRQTDTVIEQRIEQVDEVVGRRIGNIDVTVTKQGAGFEQALLRLAVLVGLVAFVGFVLWRLWDDLGDLGPTLAQLHQRRWAQAGLAARTLGGRFLVRAGAAGLAGLVLWLLYDRLPRGPSRRLDQLVEQQRQALDASFTRLELTPVRHHASQLEILDPARGHVYRAQVAKAGLMRDVLARPTLLRTPEGVARLALALDGAELQAGPRGDPDLLVLKAFVLWQVGQLRSHEREAAALCARALQNAPGGFPLAPLARHYLGAYLHQPGRAADGGSDPSTAWATLLAAPSGQPPGAGDFGPIRHLTTYSRLVRQLDRQSVPAYVSMVEAHGDLLKAHGAGARPDLPAALQARHRRTDAARQVVAAWRQFDKALAEAPELSASPVVLSVFTLNDAVLTRALWFADNPAADKAAPPLSLAPVVADRSPARRPSAAAAESPASRLRRAPLRLAWRTRYAGLLGVHAQELVDAQEADRFRELERDTLAFEEAAIRLRTSRSMASSGSALTAQSRQLALAAARLGFYVDAGKGGRVSLARALLAGLNGEQAASTAAAAEGPTLEEIALADDQRRLRLL